LEKLNNDIHDRHKILEDKNLELQIKRDDNQNIILKFTQGLDNMDKLLCTEKASCKKEEVGNNNLNKNKCYKHFSLSLTLIKRTMKLVIRLVRLHIRVLGTLFKDHPNIGSKRNKIN